MLSLFVLWVLTIINGLFVVIYFYRRLAKERNSARVMKDNLLTDIRRLENVNRLKTEFISIASHQLRTPMSSIKWLIELLLESKNNLNKAQSDRLEDIYKSNERLIALVNDLLSTAKLEGGQITAKLQLVDIEKLIQSEMNAQKVEAEKRGIVLNLEKAAGMHEVETDPLLLNQSFKNILENAIFYSASNAQVDVTLTQEKNNYIIAVHNEGSEISEMEHDKLFTKFYRGPVAQRMRPEGSGLGLFIAKMAVEANGGRIWFESPTHDNGGVTFYISVPINK